MNKIILIGGTPRSGKTTLAKKLCEYSNMSWLSTDTLESIAHNYTPEKNVPSLFPKSTMRKQTNKSNDELYKTFSITEITEAYTKQARATSKAIEALVEYAAKEDWAYVIEGYHLTPALIAKLITQYPEINSVVMVNTNNEEIAQRSKNSTVKNDWIRDKTSSEETYEKIGAMINLYSTQLLNESKVLNINVVDMGQDFQQNFDTLYTAFSK